MAYIHLIDINLFLLLLSYAELEIKKITNNLTLFDIYRKDPFTFGDPCAPTGVKNKFYMPYKYSFYISLLIHFFKVN